MISSLKPLMQVTGICLGLALTSHIPAAERVSIPFADIGNIRSWHAESSDELYVQNRARQWYRITFWSPCHELPFAIGLSFVTDTLGDLNKYSSILVNGERCWFRTFEESGPLPGLEEEAE